MQFKISYPNQAISDSVQNKIDLKTKPQGSLGHLEMIALQVACIQETDSPELSCPQMLVFAADHGVTEAGVSAFPSDVTAQMVMNFVSGGAAINCFCRQNGMILKVINVGVKSQLPNADGLINSPVAYGTRNFIEQPAMSESQLEEAMDLGCQQVNHSFSEGCNVIGFGEMGIGNTTAATAIFSALSGYPVADCVGRGTGIDDQALANKRQVIEMALERHQLNAEAPLRILACVGGFEIAAMVGAMLSAASNKMIILVDGYIATSAALIASALYPAVKGYMIFSHCSDEQAHKEMLAYLGGRPLLNLSLRLGEGSGGAIAYPIVQSAVGFLNDMASFDDAGVSQSESD